MSQSPPSQALPRPATQRPAHDPSNSSNTASLALDVTFQSTQYPPNVLHIPSSESSRLVPLVHPSGNVVSIDIVAAWKAQLSRLSAPERKMFERHSARDLTQYLNNVETLFESQGQKSRAIKVARLFKPLFDTMNLYAPIARTMAQADPTSSALVLGGITCIMSISQRFLSYHEKITEMLGEMGKKVDILLRYGSEIYYDNTEVLNAIIIVFGDILEFCSTAWHMFRRKNGEPRSSAKTFFTSLGKSYETKFGEIISKLERDLKIFEEIALQSDRRDAKLFQTESRGFYAEVRDHLYSQVNAVSGFPGSVDSIGRPLLAANSQRRIQEMQSRETAPMESLEEAKERKERLLKEMIEKREKIIQWLPSTEYHEDQDKRFTNCLEGTGEWLLRDQNYQEWKSSKDSCLLWVHGKNGCGKSHVASLVIQSLDELIDETKPSGTARNSATALAYIFCNLLYLKNIDPAKLLGSLLQQLCHMLPKPEIDGALETLYDKHAEVRKLKAKEIQDAIQSILGRFAQTYIVVDGLDECHLLGDEKFKSTCDFLASLTIPRPDDSVVKVLAFSRPGHSQIQSAFADSFRIAMDSGANSSDIMNFIADKLSSFSFLQNDTSLLEEIKQKLLARADGMFLYIALTITMLAKARSPNDLRKKIKELPHTLGQVYQRSMSDIIAKEDTKDEALRILLWITNASRPLRREELLEALSIESGVEGLEDGDRLFDDRFFISACADLITLDRNQCYQLIHSSLSEYLSETTGVETQIPPEYLVLQCVAHRTLAETCLTYLNFSRFGRSAASRDSLTELTRVSPFLAYAAENWGRHVHLAEDHIEDLSELTMAYLSSAARRELSLQILMRTDAFPFRGTTSQLHILAIFNLVDVAASMRDTKTLKLERDGLEYIPLDYALQFRSREICNWLLQDLDRNGSPNHTVLDTRLPMHVAAINDWSEVIESLIAWGCDIELKDSEKKRTPLHVAVFHGSEHAFEALINAKANIDASDEDGSTPLILAIMANQLKICQALLAYGAKVNIEADDNRRALHYACLHGNRTFADLLFGDHQFYQKLYREHDTGLDQTMTTERVQLEIMDLILAKGADIEARDWKGFSALHMACCEGHLSSSLRLIEHGANVNALTDNKATVLHAAAANGQLHLIRGLMESHRQSLIGMLNSKSKDGSTPLHNAANKRDTETARFLLEQGADVNIVNNRGQSPLYRATLKGCIETATLLAKDFKANVDIAEVFGQSALHIAVSLGRTDLIALMLDCNADLRAVTLIGSQVAHIAAESNQIKSLLYLLERYPDLELTSKDNDGWTPLHIAAESGYVDFVDILAEKARPSVSLPNQDGNLAIHRAADNGHLEVVKRLHETVTIDHPGIFLRTPLHMAAMGGHDDVVEYLIASKADLNAVDEDGNSPLDLSIRKGHARIANMLLDHGADPHHVTKKGGTALHFAIYQEDVFLVHRLLELKCDGLKLDDFQETPFWRAILANNDEILDAFLEREIWDWKGSDREGTTWLHLIAATGRLERLEKLARYVTPEILNACDNLGQDALTYAAVSGRIHMMDVLISLGLSSRGTRPIISPRLVEVAHAGGVNALGKLIVYGDNVNCVAKISQTTPLHAASKKGFHLIIDILLEAGADVSCYDVYGLTPYDWAQRHGFAVQHKIRPTAKHPPLDFRSRGSLLQETVQELTDSILALSETRDDSTTESPSIRFQYLYALSVALIEMNSTTATDAAVICCLELCFASGLGPSADWECDICNTSRFPTNRYACRKNFNVGLCQNCYEDYSRGESPCAPSEDVRSLQRLENEVQPLRKVVANSIHWGSNLLGLACKVVPLPRSWIERTLQEYEKWELTTRSHLKSARRPGQQLLKLLQKAYKATDIENLLSNDEDDSSDYNQLAKTYEELDKDFNEHFMKYPADLESFYFNCIGHEFLQIPGKGSATDEQKLCLDTDFRVNQAWLSKLPEQLSQWTNDKPENNGGSKKSEESLAELQVRLVSTTEDASISPANLKDTGASEAFLASDEDNRGSFGMRDGKGGSSMNSKESLAEAEKALIELKSLLSSLNVRDQSNGSETDETEEFFDAMDETLIHKSYPWDYLGGSSQFGTASLTWDIIQAMCLGHVRSSLLDELDPNLVIIIRDMFEKVKEEEKRVKKSLVPSEQNSTPLL